MQHKISQLAIETNALLTETTRKPSVRLFMEHHNRELEVIETRGANDVNYSRGQSDNRNRNEENRIIRRRVNTIRFVKQEEQQEQEENQVSDNDTFKPPCESGF